MASKEQSVILKKARLTEHPLRLSPQPATKQQSAMHLKPFPVGHIPSTSSDGNLPLSFSVPCAPFNPAGNSSHIVSFRPPSGGFGRRAVRLLEKGPLPGLPPAARPAPDLTQFASRRCASPVHPCGVSIRQIRFAPSNTETRPRSRVPIRSLSKWPTSCRPPRRPVGTALCARFVGSRPLPLSHLLHGRIGHLLPALATRSPRRHLPAPPSWQDHGVFAQHNKFGTFEVPKTFLNNDKEAAECAAEVAEKQAAKKAVKQSKTAQKTKKEASAEQAKAVPSKAVRATPSKATVAVHMSHVMALLPTGRPACSHGPGRTSANDEPPVPMRAPPHLDPLRLGARDALLWAMLWALVAIGRRAGA